MKKLGVGIAITALGVATAACGDSGGTSGSGGGGTGGGGSGGSTTTSTTSTTTTTTTTTTTGGAMATCASFCADYIATCTTAPDWATAGECETECAGWAQGMPGDMGGNTLECRAYHVGAAANDPTTHCPHAGSNGGGVCI
jgi:hypothetical protein